MGESSSTGATGALPGVSYVMPVLNEAPYVRAAVERLLAQDYEGPYDITLAVGPSNDGTEVVLAELAREHPNVRVVPNPAASTSAGLNQAIRASAYPVVIRVDAHSLLPSDYTRIAVETLRRTGADNVGGLMDARGTTPFEKAVARAYKSRIGLGGTQHHVGGKEGPAQTAYLGSFRRDRLEAVGLFDEGVRRGQDWELNRRLRAAGGTVWFTPRLVVTYQPRSSIRSLVHQFFATGMWRGELVRRFASANSARYFAPPVLVLLLAASVIVGLVGLAGLIVGAPIGWLALAFAVPVLYVLFVVAAAAAIASRDGFAAMLRFIVVVPTIHVSWGVGFIGGFFELSHDLHSRSGR
ncbi:glycosyltransferase family 2 protein [Planctomonas sp. JC2975]|uniref:glycosyltransferase family 2 protein n=1 Tax=Planctomonas sp. JC2975 TaxID=2729626 RepID=UPI0014758279|nr:glycosyltransferase family 2 protein [Planctomonas sp. JC2975]NNC11139.1 glycosyltransferase family 2 protein [Planctomonas sp. JC2975]